MVDNTKKDPQSRHSVTGHAPYDFSEQIGHLLRKSYQRHLAIFQQNIPDSQLTSAQFVVLCAVQEHAPCSLADIVKATAIDQATVRGVIERLKARELIAVTHDTRDKRKVMITLNKAGKALLDKTVPFAHRISEDTFAQLNPAERVAIVYLLRKLSE